MLKKYAKREIKNMSTESSLKTMQSSQADSTEGCNRNANVVLKLS